MKWIIPYDGTDWYYEDDRRPTIYEAQLMAAVSGGLFGDALTRGLASENPDAWLAALVVARKRSGMPADRARKVDSDRVEMDAAVDATYAEMQRAKSEAAEEPSKPVTRGRGRKPATVPTEDTSAA